MKRDPEVLYVLKEHDLIVSDRPTSYNQFEVFDCDGELRFNITDRMPADDLNVMIRYAERRWRHGVEAGRASLRGQLLSILGAASSDHTHPLED